MRQTHALPRIAARGLVALATTLAMAGPTGAASSGTDPRAEIATAEAAAFTQADADGSGALSSDEFTTFNELMRAQLDALRFNRLDANGDGVLTQAELAAGPPAGGPPPPPF